MANCSVVRSASRLEAPGSELKCWANSSLTKSLAGCLIVLLLVSAVSSKSFAENDQAERGVVVESIGSGDSFEQAGILPGDILTRWERLPNPPSNPQGDGGFLLSAFDLDWTLSEHAPRGAIILEGKRGTERVQFRVENDMGWIVSRPLLHEAALVEYERARELEREELEEAIVSMKRAVGATEDRSKVDRAWLRLKLAGLLAYKKDAVGVNDVIRAALKDVDHQEHRALIWHFVGNSYINSDQFDLAIKAYESALSFFSSEHQDSVSAARSLNFQGEAAYRQSDFDFAEAVWNRAASILDNSAPGSYVELQNINYFSVLAFQRSELGVAQQRMQEALKILEAVAPESDQMAVCLGNLGGLSVQLGELKQAEDYVRRAIEVRKKIGQESVEYSMSINDLATLLMYQGDLAGAEEMYREALATTERIRPSSLDVAVKLSNLGSVLTDRGKLEEALSLLKRALEIRETLVPGSVDVSSTLNNLASLEFSRGELDAAELYWLRALEISKQVTPKSLDNAIKLSNLGTLATRRGELKKAEDYKLRALELREQLAPGTPDVAMNLTGLGTIALEQGAINEALDFFSHSDEIWRNVAPSSLDSVVNLNQMGLAMSRSGMLDEAERLYRKALSIVERSAPRSREAVWTLKNLGELYTDSGRALEAAELLQRALDIVEDQVTYAKRAADSRGRLTATYIELFRTAIAVELEAQRTSRAFSVLERGRGRGFLELFSERDLVLARDLPLKLDQRRRTLSEEFDREYDSLLQASLENDEKKIQEAAQSLIEIRLARDDLADEIREAAPRIAMVQYPDSLDFEEARSMLDSGTALLAYNVSAKRADVFLISRGRRLATRRLPLELLPDGDLSNAVMRLRELLEVPGRRRGAVATSSLRTALDDLGNDSSDLKDVASSLFDVLIRPVENELEDAERLLILPDGALHMLPFGALVRQESYDTSEEVNATYLIEWKPVHVALSATVYSQLKKLRERQTLQESFGTAGSFVAFGNPEGLQLTGVGEITNPEVRYAERRACGVGSSINHSQREVKEIRAIFGEQNGTVFLGPAATESEVKALPRDTRVLHFATHGCLDDRFPLSSYLVLNISRNAEEDQDNGLLQAWEIIEDVRIDADLVVLSACSTALGAEQGGDGLIGLSRAFQIAGARSVVASFWNVDDQVTADLMVQFYRHLKTGMTKDEALRAAQISILHGDGISVEFDTSHPYYWAAFQVIGDYK